MGAGVNEILGVMLIDNRITRTMETKGKRADYRARLWKKRNAAHVFHANALAADESFKPWDQTTVKDFPRQAYHPWNIVRLALNQIFDRRGQGQI